MTCNIYLCEDLTLRFFKGYFTHWEKGYTFGRKRLQVALPVSGELLAIVQLSKKWLEQMVDLFRRAVGKIFFINHILFSRIIV